MILLDMKEKQPEKAERILKAFNAGKKLWVKTGKGWELKQLDVLYPQYRYVVPSTEYSVKFRNGKESNIFKLPDGSFIEEIYGYEYDSPFTKPGWNAVFFEDEDFQHENDILEIEGVLV